MYFLDDNERRGFPSLFERPFSEDLISDRDWLGDWTELRREPGGRILLRHATRAMVWLVVRGGMVVEHELIEGEPARILDDAYGYLIKPEARAQLTRAFRVGRPANEAVEEIFGSATIHARFLGKRPGVAGPGERHYHLLHQSGLVVLHVDASGRIEKLELVEGPDVGTIGKAVFEENR